jgi:hypothetical protein
LLKHLRQLGTVHADVNGIDLSYSLTPSVADENVVRASVNGSIRAVGAGTTTITYSYKGTAPVDVPITITAATEATATTANPALPILGGAVLIEGTDLDNVNEIAVDGVLVTEFLSNKAGTELSFVAPAHDAGTVDIALNGFWGDNTVIVSGTYS